MRLQVVAPHEVRYFRVDGRNAREVRVDAKDYNGWAKRFLWPFNLPAECPVHELDPGSEACVEWISEFQRQHGLLVDGRLGPSTLYACVAVYHEGAGGVGGLLIGGETVDIGVPVARMRSLMAEHQTLSKAPDLCVLLSTSEMERATRSRRLREKPLRSHFAIDGSRGVNGKSLIIQWADPLCIVDFVPVLEPSDYPANRQAVGIELENPLTAHHRDSDARRWQRKRNNVSADINGRVSAQLEYHPEQLQSLILLMDVLESRLGLPRQFPIRNGKYDTYLSSNWQDHKGYLARFNFEQRLNEPGAGLVQQLPTLFGPLATDEPTAVKSSSTKIRPAAAEPPPPLDVVTNDERRSLKKAWDAPVSSAVAPPVVDRESFSLSRSLKSRRGRRQSGLTRAESLRARLLDKPSQE
ncbi:MAG: hypothetical protein AUK47_04090 [Deltaproteobacteria bacterium CG2_30_63_29]|nr:MAG: hypothetical protein AUK47_04090 [Deltaproteobacteria bacterium CG2_30_63_29]